MKRYLIALILVPILIFVIGCTSSNDAEIGYTESSINNEIPIPKNAKQIKITTNSSNPNIKIGVQYELKNIGGEQGLYTPDRYFQKLKDLEWAELEDKRMGHVHFFKKEDTVIAIELGEDTFEVYEMIKNAKF